MTFLSLKEESRKAANELGIPHDSLYTVQRRLVLEGALSPRPGRGPGSGVEFTAANLAILLTEYFASQPLNVLADAATLIQARRPR